MIAGYYYEQKVSPTDRIPSFYLPNKMQFKASIGHDFEERLSRNRCINEEILIFAHFCEIVGPAPLIVFPRKSPLSAETIDMIVLKAMSVDYQSCEHGEVVLNMTTQSLILDCSIQFFAHYFTLWDIYARGYVRPCCLIVCCRDKIRARELFIAFYDVLKTRFKPLMVSNIGYFYQDLLMNKEVIDSMLQMKEDNEFFKNQEISFDHLVHLKGEYCNLISNIEEQTTLTDLTNTPILQDMLLDTNLAKKSIQRELRSIYLIMNTSEADITGLLASISKMFSEASVSESFSLLESDQYKEMKSAIFNPIFPEQCFKYNMQYFHTAFAADRHFLNIGKSIPLCQCRSLLDNFTGNEALHKFRDVHSESLFPNLIHIKASQCHFVSHNCKQLGIPIVTRLIACLFNQCHLIIYVNTQLSYFHLIKFLLFFLPKSHNVNYFSCKNDWPTLEQLEPSPVIFLNKDIKSLEMPSYLRGFVALYDYTTNQFLAGPKYTKGHLTNFLDSFKSLDYNHYHLEMIVNVLLLNYVDMIYLWATLVGRRDRRWITEDYLIKLGYSPEDVVISEKLTLLVFQTLAKLKVNPEQANLFLTSPSVFNIPFRRESK